MKISVIREDGAVVVDGQGYVGLDVSSIPEFIHGIYWYEDHGEMEFVDSLMGKPQNKEFADISILDTVLAVYNAKKAELAAAEAEQLRVYNLPENVAQRAAEAIDSKFGSRLLRDVALEVLPVDHPRRAVLEAAEAEVLSLGIRK